MIIKYAKSCPECAKANKKNSLNRDLDDPEKIFCSEGHSFDEATLQEQEAPTPQEMPTPRPLTPMAPPPAPSAEVTVMPVQSTRTMASVGAGTAIEVLDGPLPDLTTAVMEKAPPVSSTHAKISSKVLSGGDVQINVRIPEVHANFIRAEAESQGLTFEEYFDRELQYGLDKRWFY